MIKVLFFAQLAEVAEHDSIEVDFIEGITIRGLVTSMAKTVSDELISALQFDATMLSVNQVFAAWDDLLSDGDEVAFLPPFSGG